MLFTMNPKVCRVCLESSATISLFEQQGGVQYRAQITKCVSLNIEEGDGLPDAICAACARDLAVSFQFVLKCESSDRALRSLHTQALDLKEETLRTEADKSDLKEITPMDIKLEPCPKEWIEYDEKDFDDYLNQYSDAKNELYLDSKPMIELISESKKRKNETKTRNKYKKKTSQNHLRKAKPKVYTGPIECPTCGRVVPCQSAYELHLRSHTKEKPFGCDICKKSFANKNSVKEHIYRHYGIDLRKQRKSLPEWDGRKNRKHSAPILCVTCGLKLKCPSALEVHMRQHTGEKPYPCSECDKRFRLKGCLRRHFDLTHNKIKDFKYICEHCGKKFNDRGSIICHLRIHTGERPYSCPFCPCKFAQLSSLTRHKRIHTDERPFPCQICGKAFRDSSLRTKHLSVHSDVKSFICHICNRALKSKQALKVHIDTHNNPNRFVCNFCGLACTTKGNLQTHISRAHSHRAGGCRICDKEFPDLQAHMRIHSGEKPYKCKLCSQAFMTQRSLSFHFSFRHRDSSKFKCSTGECEQTFRTIAMLEFHVLKAHLASTPYACAHCARPFLRPSDLSRHLKLSHSVNTHVKSQFIKTVQKINPS